MYQNPPEGTQPLMPPQYIPPAGPTVAPGQPMPPLAQPYPNAQPVQAPIQNQPIIVNQTVPVVPVVPVKFLTSPISVVCPYCSKQVVTNVETQFNCCNCCFCFCFCLLWLIVQLASGKELNCTDANHKCPSCGRLIGQYKAC